MSRATRASAVAIAAGGWSNPSWRCVLKRQAVSDAAKNTDIDAAMSHFFLLARAIGAGIDHPPGEADSITRRMDGWLKMRTAAARDSVFRSRAASKRGNPI